VSRPSQAIRAIVGGDLSRRAVAIFLPLAVLATLTCGLVYVEVQQALRSGANDPQYQMAEDTASRLDAGAKAADLVDTAERVDAATSLAPFTIIFDSAGRVLASDVVLDGGQPVPPSGVLSAAKPGSPNAVTWQPREGVRIASVTVAWSGGTVLVGRSLQRVEEQEWNTQLIAGAAWLVALVALAGAAIVAAWVWPTGAEGRYTEPGSQ
jgi:hypothetical protein